MRLSKWIFPIFKIALSLGILAIPVYGIFFRDHQPRIVTAAHIPNESLEGIWFEPPRMDKDSLVLISPAKTLRIKSLEKGKFEAEFRIDQSLKFSGEFTRKGNTLEGNYPTGIGRVYKTIYLVSEKELRLEHTVYLKLP